MAVLQEDNLGAIKISDDVIMLCAAKAALKVKGVHDLAGGITDNLSKSILGVDSASRGIKLSKNDVGIVLDIYVIVDYLVNIPQLAWDIQSTIKKEIEKITALTVSIVNIHVQGVTDPEEGN